MTERTEWDERIPRPTLTDMYVPDDLRAAEIEEPAATPVAPSPVTAAPRVRSNKARFAVAAALVAGLGVGVTAGYVLWEQPKQKHIEELQVAVAATSGDAAQLKALSDDNVQLADKLAAASGEATACRKAARAAQGLDSQWRDWAQEFEKFADVTTEAQARKLADTLQSRYDKIVRQEGRVDTLAEECSGRGATTAA